MSLMRYFFLFSLLIVSLLVFAPIQSTIATTLLPNNILTPLKHAEATQDRFVLFAVTKTLKETYPSYTNQIDTYLQTRKRQKSREKTRQLRQARRQGNILASTTTTPEANRAIAKKESQTLPKKRSWKSSTELGITFVTGNKKEQDIHLASTIDYSLLNTENTFKFRTKSSKQDNIRINEEYRLKNQTRYNLSANDYMFGELEYVNDRFSGYNHRISELLGYGRSILTHDRYNIKGEVSIGARQSRLETGEDENSFLGKVSTIGDWKILDNLSLTQEITSAIASEAVITESNTALKSSLTDTLYLKLGLDIEHISDVPAGRKNTDTSTNISVGYDF